MSDKETERLGEACQGFENLAESVLIKKRICEERSDEANCLRFSNAPK